MTHSRLPADRAPIPGPLPALRWLALALGAAAAALAASLAPARASAPEPVRVAYVGGLTGDVSQSAAHSLKVLKLQVANLNARGGILGRPVELLSYDTQGLAVNNLRIFSELKKAGAHAIVGAHASNDALPLSRLAEENHLPFVVISATHPDIVRGKRYVVRTCFNDDTQGTQLARLAARRLGARRIALVTDVSDSFTLNLAETFRREFAASHGEIIAEHSIRTGEKDFTRIVAGLAKAARPDLVFLATSGIEASKIISQASTAHLKLTYLGSDGWQNQDMMKALQGLPHANFEAYFTAHWHRGIKNAPSAQLLREYEREYKEPLSSFDADAVLSRDAMMLFEAATRRAGSLDPEKLANALHSVSIDGATGAIRIGPSGEPAKPIHFMKILGGELQELPGKL